MFLLVNQWQLRHRTKSESWETNTLRDSEGGGEREKLDRIHELFDRKKPQIEQKASGVALGVQQRFLRFDVRNSQNCKFLRRISRLDQSDPLWGKAPRCKTFCSMKTWIGQGKHFNGKIPWMALKSAHDFSPWFSHS